ncbi:MAG: prephenate dehydrogenase [Bacteroidota bacterium]
MIVTVVGTGLIGGSMALKLREQGIAEKVIGVDKDEQHLKEAKSMGIIDEFADLNDAVMVSGLVIIAVPVNIASEMLANVLDILEPGTIVMDVGSTKEGICARVFNHINRKNYVATHPIAGTENTGPSAAFPDLFTGKVNIICDKERSSKEALDMVKKVYTALSMRIIFMDSREHDLHIAYVSHLSHISSFTLGLTVLEIEKNEKNIFDMAGSGFASTVRLAKSSPDMWAPIFDQNATNISDALGVYIEKLKLFKSVIDNHDMKKAHELIEQANDIRRILKS